MPPAARVSDNTIHGTPLTPGIGSPSVLIGFMPAWRALPASVGAAVESVSNAVKSFMQNPSMTPANAAADIAQITSGLGEAAGKAAGEGNAAAAGTATGAAAALNTTNAALTTAWTAASAAPGGQPAANQAYTEGIKAAMAVAASSVFASIGGMADTHICPVPCPIPPHGPGMVTKGSSTVVINNLSACRQGDKVFEACGGEDPIALGCLTVLIGDDGGGGGGGGGAGGAGSSGGGAGQTSTADAPQGEAEPTYTETEAESAPPGESEQSVGTGTHWIEIEMVDEAEQAVVGELYEITLPDGNKVRGGLDSAGQARITGIEQPGGCGISFKNLDLAAWERWTPAAGSARAAGGGPAQAPPGAADEGPVAGGTGRSNLGAWRPVRQGECIASIAKDTGHFWDTIWNHGLNRQLKERRGDPNVLLPGDAVFVPNKRTKQEAGNTDLHHKFRRKGEPAWLRLRLMDDDEPRANAPYTLTIDGQERSGTTDADGNLSEPVPGNARRAMLSIDDLVYQLPMGCVDPVNQLTGVQQRLLNLGHNCGPVDGRLGDQTRAALKKFQKKQGLTQSGEPDPQTCDKLRQVHGS